ncbi:MAG TPA: PQQ-binding-like beta-propeller repeat protein [Planctomycetia bacterium]|nr:PQQ-binding-like beta-propeller repeat protein [Planctomycetia bacterium]
MNRLLACLASAALVGSVAAADPLVWPQFRGPNGSGVADGQKPPTVLGPDKNVKWKVPVSNGFSSPIVVGDKLVLTAFDDGKLYTIAYDRADGKVAWKIEAPAKKIELFYKQASSPASSTPATDGQRIVSYFGSCGLICYDLSGKQLWQYEMPTAETFFGSGVSPIVADGLALLVRDQFKDAKIVALDVVTGKVKWEKPRQTATAYCTPVTWDANGEKQAVVAGHGRMVAYDLKSGEEKWHVKGMPSGCCTSPVAAEGALVFAGWSPGGPDDKDFQMPSFDSILKGGDTNKDGAIDRVEAKKTMIGDFFDVQDTDKDGKITAAEWDAMTKMMADGKNGAFAVKPGASGDATKSHVAWRKDKGGLPYLASAIAYRGKCFMVKDGGLVSALDLKTGAEVYPLKRALAPGQYWASPVAANGKVYFTALEDGAVSVANAEGPALEVTKNPPLGEKVIATPAIADDTLYIRGEKHLYAFGEK